MGALSQFKGLPKQVYYLSAIRVIMALGSLVFPFLSLMMTSYLGFNEFQSGCVMIFVSAGNIVGSFGGGQLGDMYGRKKVFVKLILVITIMLIVVVQEFF